MALTASQIFQLSRLTKAKAKKLDLGQLISDAGDITASEISLANGKILVGNASGVSEAQTVSGDFTISNAGVGSIGAGKVLESMVQDPSSSVLSLKRACIGVFDATGGVAAGSVAITASIPDNAIIQRVDYEVITTFTSATDAATIALTTGQGANDVISAVAINDGGNPWDSGVPKVTLITGATNTWVKFTAAHQFSAVVATEDLTAGVLRIYVDYVESV